MTASLFIYGVCAFSLTVLAAWAARRLAFRVMAIDQPTGGRKIHQKPTPLLGGIGIGVTVGILVGVAWYQGALAGALSARQLFGFLLGLLLILVVGFLDDVIPLSAKFRFGTYALACLIVVASGTVVTQVTRLGGGAVALPFWFGAPATFFWLMGVTFAIKIMDGLDGLVTSQTAIGAGLIAMLALSAAYFQPAVALLAIIIGASYAGFLPWNAHPAKQFLGESGSVLAGFCLAFLAVVSGAKVATAFMALGLPLVDTAIVMVGRVRRGVSPFQGDDTHLHFKLLKAGLTQRQVVFLYWGVTSLFGILAFAFQTRGKIFLIAALILVVLVLSTAANWRLRRVP